jgi:hypothetical protein
VTLSGCPSGCNNNFSPGRLYSLNLPPDNPWKISASADGYLGAHAKIWNPTTTPSGVLATAVTTRKKKKEKYGK